MKKLTAAILVALLAASSGVAGAQTAIKPSPAEEAKPGVLDDKDPCRADPKGNQAVKPDTADTLQHCKSVLKPPQTGDDIVTPAPDVGKMPVIPPSAVPEQQKPQKSQ